MTDKARRAHGKPHLADSQFLHALSSLPGDKQLPEPGTMQSAVNQSVSDFRSNESPSSYLINSAPMDRQLNGSNIPHG